MSVSLLSCAELSAVGSVAIGLLPTVAAVAWLVAKAIVTGAGTAWRVVEAIIPLVVLSSSKSMGMSAHAGRRLGTIASTAFGVDLPLDERGERASEGVSTASFVLCRELSELLLSSFCSLFCS